MTVGELIRILQTQNENTIVKIGANLIREIYSVDVTQIAKTDKNGLYPWVEKRAWDNYKVDMNTAENCVLIQVK